MAAKNDKSRTIILRYYHPEKDGDKVIGIDGETESGGRYSIRLADFNMYRAQGFLREIARSIAAQIRDERDKHRWIKDVVATAFHDVAASLKEARDD